jgi:hypothetical protein
LKGVYRQDKAFIRLEDAHMNIGFSCLAYLNSSFSLLPQNSSKEERIGRVLQGLHGLQPYANQYWYTHLLDYLDLATARKAEIPEHFIQQLREILKYGKEESVEESHEAAETSNSRTIPTINELAALGSFPGLQSLISKLKGFQDGLKRSDWAQKSIESKHMLVPRSFLYFQWQVLTLASCLGRDLRLRSFVVQFHSIPIPTSPRGPLELKTLGTSRK